jgi:DNA-binding NarL/FixJ family response regulator
MAVTVLIVDDHPTFRRFARRLLEASGFNVVGEAGDGAGALVATQELEPSVVLLDVMLPDVSGLEVAQALAREFASTSVVLTSSRSASDLGAALEHTPALGFVEKSALTGAAISELIGRP